MGALPAEHNWILEGLPRTELDGLLPLLEHRRLPLGSVLHEASEAVEALVFPLTGIISLVQELKDGRSGEIGMVGREGAQGLGLVLGSRVAPNRAVVQSECEALMLRASALPRALEASPELRRGLLRYTQAMIVQIQQTAICNRHHAIEQQLCRWLLLSLDRLSAPILNMTQQLIAQMLGVRREGVTLAAGALQRDGLIRYGRGSIEVLDRPGLEGRCCECYGLSRDESARLLGAF